MAALNVLVVIPAPSDMTTADPDHAWDDLSRALQPLVARGALTLERLPGGSENALKQRLTQATCSILHFIGCGSSRSAAQYGTLIFEDSAKRSRGVNAQYLAALLKQHETLQLVVLQACQEGDDPLGALADTLVNHGVPAVVSTPRLATNELAGFAEEFYGELIAQRAGEQAIQSARNALIHRGRAVPSLRLRTRRPDWHLTCEGAAQPIALQPKAVPSPPGRELLHAATEAPIRAGEEISPRTALDQRFAQEIARKRAAGEFDVFLCHNWADKPAIKKIAHQLIACGIRPWLDEWELTPGRPWQPLLEQQIANIKSAAVFVGAAGIGPWQEQEINGFLRQFVKRANPVIPVLLPTAPDKPALPIFLEAMTWVDFRLTDPEPLERLIWGITGERTVRSDT